MLIVVTQFSRPVRVTGGLLEGAGGGWSPWEPWGRARLHADPGGTLDSGHGPRAPFPAKSDVKFGEHVELGKGKRGECRPAGRGGSPKRATASGLQWGCKELCRSRGPGKPRPGSGGAGHGAVRNQRPLGAGDRAGQWRPGPAGQGPGHGWLLRPLTTQENGKRPPPPAPWSRRPALPGGLGCQGVGQGWASPEGGRASFCGPGPGARGGPGHIHRQASEGAGMDPGLGRTPGEGAPQGGHRSVGARSDSPLRPQVPGGGLLDRQAANVSGGVPNGVQVLCLLCSFSPECSVGLSLAPVTLTPAQLCRRPPVRSLTVLLRFCVQSLHESVHLMPVFPKQPPASGPAVTARVGRDSVWAGGRGEGGRATQDRQVREGLVSGLGAVGDEAPKEVMLGSLRATAPGQAGLLLAGLGCAPRCPEPRSSEPGAGLRCPSPLFPWAPGPCAQDAVGGGEVSPSLASPPAGDELEEGGQ